MTVHSLPFLGFGLGLRARHYAHIFEQSPAVDWFEIVSENFMDTDGRPRRNLARIKERYPIVMHGVSLSIGTVDPLNSEYLAKLKALIDWVQPAWISDHLCWTGVAHRNTHDLLPVPYTEQALAHVVRRIKQVQDYLEHPIALENPSTYLEFQSSSMPEAEFIARMAEESGCRLLLDVNNVYVTCYNHGLDPQRYLDALPMDRVVQVHLSGHSNKGTHIVDTHDGPVVDAVWELYKYVVHKSGRALNTMIEWDEEIPEFQVLDRELRKARAAARQANAYERPHLVGGSALRRSTPAALMDEQLRLQNAIFLGDAGGQPEQWIVGKEGFAPSQQLEVYVSAYRHRLYDATAEDYPVLRHHLGDDAFRDLLWNFVDTERPEHFNIARFPLKLQKFVAERLPKDVFAQELVQLETEIAQLADTRETRPLEQQHLAGLTSERLMSAVLHPRDALRLMAFKHAVNEYYQAVMDGRPPQAPAIGASHLVVFRHDDRVWRMELEAAEYELLEKLFDGLAVGDALGSVDDAAATRLTEWFSRWMRNGLLAAREYTLGHQEDRTDAAA